MCMTDCESDVQRRNARRSSFFKRGSFSTIDNADCDADYHPLDEVGDA
jgi:hypothetical protein